MSRPIPVPRLLHQAIPTDPLLQSRLFATLIADLRRTAKGLTRSTVDADDLVQETLLRVWTRLAMAASAKSDAAPIDDLRAYAFTTLRHRAFARAGGIQGNAMGGGRTSVGAPDAQDLVAPRGSDAVSRLGCAEALAALAALPEDQQVLLNLRAVDGLSYAEIERRTGLPAGTVTSRLARGRAALRAALDLPPGAPVTDLLGGD